jgi:surface carbohydrate biosynthesis protein (TIGR04326 family)
MLQNGSVVNRRIVLVSNLTDPEKIKPHLRGGIWVYAGNDLDKFHAFKKCLGKEVIHASPAQFREFTISNRHAFVKWSERVHSQYGHDLTHWLSDTFSSNPYMSNLFSDFMNLAWLRSLLNEHPEKDIAFIAESHALLSVADAISSEDSGNEIYKYGFIKERIRVLSHIGSSIFNGYVSFLRLIVRYMLAYAYRIPDLNNKLRNLSVIIDTYILEGSFDEEGKFKNRYFSGLHEFLCNTGIAVGIFAVFHKVPLKKLKHTFKSMYQGNIRFILIEDYLKPVDYICSFFWPLKRLWCFEKVQDFLGIRIQPLVDEENWIRINSSNSILSLLVNKLPKRIRENGMSPRAYINWSENHLVNRAMIAGFHHYSTKTEVIGGKPFIPPPNNLNLFNTESERISGYAPDRIITCGKELKNIFSIYDREGNYNEGASFRHSYLRGLIDNNQIHSGDTSNRGIISVFLPYSELISKHVLASSKKAIHNAMTNGWNIKIKMHPTIAKSDSVVLLNEYDMKSDSIELTCEDVESLLPETSAVITSASSVAIEAVCLGIPVVSIGMPIGLDFNMLDYLPSSMWKFVVTDEDIDSGLNEWALCHPIAFEERREIGRKVLVDFFGEDTNESLQTYMESLKSI